jgi:hypothetical protein
MLSQEIWQPSRQTVGGHSNAKEVLLDVWLTLVLELRSQLTVSLADNYESPIGTFKLNANPKSVTGYQTTHFRAHIVC